MNTQPAQNRNRFGLFTAAIVGLLAYSAAMAAELSTWPPPGVSYFGRTIAPNITGLWIGTLTGVPGVPFAPNRGSADGRPATFWAPWPPPYKPAFQKIYEDRIAAAKAGRALGDYSAKCVPFGLPLMLTTKVYPDEVVQTPGQVTIFVNNTLPIMIWTDGRPHPKDLQPSFNGHSIGYWVGNTLFVDTVGLNGLSALNSARNPVGPHPHLKWTIQPVAKDTLHVYITLYDDDAFTEPMVTTNIWKRVTDPNWQVLDDASCFENNRNEIDESGAVGFKKY